jgi:hypothetical protein
MYNLNIFKLYFRDIWNILVIIIIIYHLYLLLPIIVNIVSR